MQHGDAAVELGLHIGIAGGRECHLAELFVLLADCAACERRGDQASGKQDSPRLRVHRKSPLWLASDGPRACSIDRVRLRLLLWLQILTVARSSCQGVTMRTYASVQGPQNQYRMNGAMLARRGHRPCLYFTGFGP